MRPLAGQDLEPPPANLRWIAFKGATVPPETRDGRKWGGQLGTGTMADPYAILFLNGKPILKTSVQGNTLTPTWPGSPAGNFRVRDGDHFRVELWDSNPVNDHPIGVKDIGAFKDDVVMAGEADIECDTGAHVQLAYEPAHARLGLGLHYELRVGEVVVTRVYEESPAGRAGLKPGDQMLSLEDKPVSKLKPAEIQSILNVPHMNGLAVKVAHPGGREAALSLKEGSIYPLFWESGTLRD